MNTPQDVAYGSPSAVNEGSDLLLFEAASAQTADHPHLLGSQLAAPTASVDLGSDWFQMLRVDARRLMAEMVDLHSVGDGSVHLLPHEDVSTDPAVLATDAHVTSGMIRLPLTDPARGVISPILSPVVPRHDDNFLAALVMSVDKAPSGDLSATAFAVTHTPDHIASVGQ